MNRLREIVDLTNDVPIRYGRTRNVYRLPQFPGLLLKTVRPNPAESDNGPGGLRNMRTLAHQRPTFREVDEYLFQMMRYHRDCNARLPIADIHGIVRTSEGLGLLVEEIVDKNGGIAPTVRELARSGTMNGKVISSLHEMLQRCQDMHIVLHDLHAGNIVYTEQRHSRPECVCVDGLGEAALIPIHRWSKLFNGRRLRKKMNHLLRIVQN